MAQQGQRRVSAAIGQAIDLAANLGAHIVGLGGYTTPYSRRGLAVVDRNPAITTGNALTAGMVFAATQRVAVQHDITIDEATIAIVGARGSVGTLLTRLLPRQRPRRMVLVGNPTTGGVHRQRLRQELSWGSGTIEVTTDLNCLAACDIVISASGAIHPVLDDAPLTPGTIICDVAHPHDASPRVRARTDLTIIDGGLVSLPAPHCRFGIGNLQGLPDDDNSSLCPSLFAVDHLAARRPAGIHAVGWCGHGVALSLASRAWITHLLYDNAVPEDLPWYRNDPPLVPIELVRWSAFRTSVGFMAL